MFRSRLVAAVLFFLTLPLASFPAWAAEPEYILQGWYKFVLELVRHTPTYSPPVASRSFAYLGITSYEAIASGSRDMVSLSGQLNGLATTPERQSGAAYDDAVILNAAMIEAVNNFFGNTGPTGKHALAAVTKRLSAEASDGVGADIVARSSNYGKAIADHVFKWSQGDGGAVVENMGFPMQYTLTKGAAYWVPTSKIGQQQVPLLPEWGKNRTFAMPAGSSCPLPPPPAYSEEKDSEFYAEALEVYTIGKSLTDERKAIARFWSDDPMLSPTPPGHWESIALQIFERDNVGLEKRVDVLARLGIAIADGFIGCWESKFEFDLLRPVTYIKRVIDPKWEPLLITPPFPEYPSGHSTQSAAAAAVLVTAFGEKFAFEDATHVKDGIKPRHYAGFQQAAEEAAISRLYGGIHFRAAIERGLEQGACIGKYVNALITRK